MMGEVTLTWNGTANLRVEWKGQAIFFDPWFTRNEKSEPRLGNTIDFVDNGASIFMSHGHFDHLQDIPAILLKKDKVNVYCSSVARAAIEQKLKEMDGVDATRLASCIDRVHPIAAGDTITHAGSDVTVGVIKSEHILFDAKSILRVLFNLEFWRNIKRLSGTVKGYPKGDVFGYDVHLGNEGRLVFFGSLCKKYPEILKEHAKPDVLVIPVAGRFNCDKIGLEVTRIVSPKIVIPVHNDNFYPPISYWTPVTALKEGAGKLDPPVRYVELVAEKPETFQIG
jgi:L-ascorbate metabolism protein UlaG (beta-lactamase superfamily)